MESVSRFSGASGQAVPSRPSLDRTLDRLLEVYARRSTLDGATEQLRDALAARLREAGVEESQRRLLEVNLLGNVAAWIEYVIEEREHGRDAVPDFARNLRKVFVTHCRKHALDPSVAVGMAMELATAILDLALLFESRLGTGQERGG